jgi:hypothetical protein
MSIEGRQMPLAVEPNGSSSVAALLQAVARERELFSNAPFKAARKIALAMT